MPAGGVLVQPLLAAGQILLDRVCMAQAVANQRTMPVSDLHGVTVPVEETLEAVDGEVGRGSIRHEQLMPTQRLPQHGFQFELRGAGQGNGADFAALVLERQLACFHRLFCRCGVPSEDLVDAQTTMPRQTDRGGIVLAALAPRFTDHAVDLLIAPCAVDFAERTAFQIEHGVGRQLGVFVARQLVVKKSDGGEIGFDAGCRAAVFLMLCKIARMLSTVWKNQLVYAMLN